MSGGFLLRDEREDDVESIDRITREAFATQAYSSKTEQFIVKALRQAGVLAISLVAEDQAGDVVGHIAFSPVTISDGSPGWYGLGPVSVAPTQQGRGIGSALVNEGLARLRALGAAGCMLLGDPAFYARFGFKVDPGLNLPGVPPGYFQGLAFYGDRAPLPKGDARYHAGFDATA